MIDEIKTKLKKISWQSLKDLRTIGLLVFLIIVLLVTWSGIKTIQSNYSLQKQVATLQQQQQVQQLENNNLQLQNEYYNSGQYLELSARQELGLGAPGETELLVPKSVALAHLASVAATSGASTKSGAHQSWYERNFQAWVNFFLHRDN